MADFRMKAVKRSSAEMNQVLAGILRRNGVADWEYSFDGGEEQCQCMEEEKGRWRVYFVERGMEHGCAEFQTQKEAARELIFRLGRTEELREKMLAELETEWKPMKVVPVRELSGEHIGWKAAEPAAAHIFDQNGNLVATLRMSDGAGKMVPEPMQTELLEKRIQEMTARLKTGEAAAKPGHKSLSRFGMKKTLRSKLDEKKKMDLRRERPDMGWKG